MIRTLIEQGLSESEIACRMGWTVGTLRVRCSKLKISLRRHAKKRAKQVKATENIALPRVVLDRMVRRAAAMGISVSSLAVDLLTTIDKDDLYNAVLDSDGAQTPSLSPVESFEISLVSEAA
jgi:hypothetical protein